MIGAGLVAKKAVERGLEVKPFVKTSLAPGSKVVTEYLTDANLIQDLQLEFLRPVYTDETVHFRGEVIEVVTERTRDRITFSLHFENQDGKVVLRGQARGLVRHPRGEGSSQGDVDRIP